jgi:hypothetical protein
MKASKFSDARKAFILMQGADGAPVACRKTGISHTAVRFKFASSTGRRNTGIKSLCWRFKLQGLAWSFV